MDHIQGNRGQTPGQRFRLKPSPKIQRNIGMALDPLAVIPVGLAVAYKIDDGNGSPPHMMGRPEPSRPRFPKREAEDRQKAPTLSRPNRRLTAGPVRRAGSRTVIGLDTDRA
jgi:hypothetical protein